MSKIKKLLALTLALAMILSVSAFAGYTVAPYGDADKVDEDCEVAVQLLYSLNIMKGDEKGNFNPTNTITRAEVAKMIYVILNYGEDDKAVNYTGAKLFSDVPAGAWFEGYVNYAATTKLVQGRGNGTFGPNDPVTTAEAAKMLLTAIGYSAEARGYVGAGWDKQVLSDAAIIGLLDGYNYSTTTYAPRQWVAVMFKNALTDAYTYGTIAPVIFNGLLTGTTLPTADYKTMGEKYFGLYKWSGVITANEYADLYGKSGLSSSNTKIDKGEYVFKNWSTDLTEIGEYRWGYAVEDGAKDLVVYVGGEDENTTFSTGEETNLSTDSKFKSATGLRRGGEYFVNFADGSFSTTGNGDWLKVIDNDGDGKADYVFKTTFKMVEYKEMDDDDVIYLSDGAEFEDYELAEDVAEDDVVLYTTIDGVTYVELAPSFKGEAEKYTYKNDALTVDGEEYVESDIDFDAKLAYFSEVELAKKDTEYVYYQDFFGHIRLFGQDVSDSGDLVLLTNAYYETNRSGSVAAVDAYLDGKIVDTDVRDSATYTDIEMFIARNTNKNDWDQLIPFAGYQGAETALARYTMNEEGVMSLFDAETWNYDTKGKPDSIKSQYITLEKKDADAGQTAYYGYVTDINEADGTVKNARANDSVNDKVKVQANKNTVYYYVSYTGGLQVKAVTGYKNSYDVIDNIVGIRAMYAVATDVSADAATAHYWVADAIVIETSLPVFNLLKNDIVLGYDIANRAVSDYAYLNAVMADGTLDGLTVVSHKADNFDTFDDLSELEVLNFFFNTEDEEGDSYLVDLTEYAKNDIYVGTVDRANKLYEYATLKNGTINELVYNEDTVVYNITENTRYNSIKTVSAGLVTGNTYIFFAPDEEIVYAILVDDALTQALADKVLGTPGLSAAQAAAIKTLKDAIVEAVKAADTNHVLASYTSVTSDDETPLNAWTETGKHDTMKEAIATWSGELSDLAGEALQNHLNTLLGLVNTAASSYVDALNAAQNAAEAAAQTAITGMEVSAKTGSASVVKAAIDAAAEKATGYACSVVLDVPYTAISAGSVANVGCNITVSVGNIDSTWHVNVTVYVD